MDNQNHNLTSDLSFVALLVLAFIGINYFSLDSGNSIQNGIFLSVAAVVLIITYFTTLLIGLAINAALIFLLTAYRVIISANTGISIPANTIFWIVWLPLTTLALSSFVSSSQKLQKRNTELSQQLDKFSTIDSYSSQKNIRAYEMESVIYMKIAARYKMNLWLIVWRLKYLDDFRRIIGKDNMQDAVQLLSKTMQNSLRGEDSLYILDENPTTWGTLVYSTDEGVAIITNRIQENLNHIDFSKFTKVKDIPVLIIPGSKLYEPETDLPLTFLELTKNKIEKD